MSTVVAEAWATGAQADNAENLGYRSPGAVLQEYRVCRGLCYRSTGRGALAGSLKWRRGTRYCGSVTTQDCSHAADVDRGAGRLRDADSSSDDSDRSRTKRHGKK